MTRRCSILPESSKQEPWRWLLALEQSGDLVIGHIRQLVSGRCTLAEELDTGAFIASDGARADLCQRLMSCGLHAVEYVAGLQVTYR